MIGLTILLLFGIYLLATFWVTRATANWARRNNRNPWYWGGLMAFVMYNLIFWDLIPTLVAHKYYCETQAGFWIFKTPMQWRNENPSISTSELKPLGKSKMLWDFPYVRLPNNPKKTVLMLNQRIYLGHEYEKNISSMLPIHKFTSFVADVHDESRLAQLVTFRRGYDNPMTNGGLTGFKFWMERSTCSGSTRLAERSPEYSSFIQKIIELGESK